MIRQRASFGVLVGGRGLPELFRREPDLVVSRAERDDGPNRSSDPRGTAARAGQFRAPADRRNVAHTERHELLPVRKAWSCSRRRP